METLLRQSELVYCTIDKFNREIIYAWFNPHESSTPAHRNFDKSNMFQVVISRDCAQVTFLMPDEIWSLAYNIPISLEDWNVDLFINEINDLKLIPWFRFRGHGIYAGITFESFKQQISYEEGVDIQMIKHYVDNENFVEIPIHEHT